MDPHQLLERLLSFERRVRQLYLLLGDRADMPPAVRFFWNCMAQDERQHFAILERSEGLLDLMETSPQVSEEVLVAIEEKIAAAETSIQRPDLNLNDALRQSLILEGSEINSLDEAWLQGFRSTVSSLLRAMMPEEEGHIRRLVEATHTFSTDKALQDQAAQLWTRYQQQRMGLAKPSAPTGVCR